MPNLLTLSIDGISAASRQMYPLLFAKVISRTHVHECLTQEEVFNYLGSDWPDIIFAGDSGITRNECRPLLEAIVEWVKNGGTLIFMGFFSQTVEYDVLDSMFKKQFGLKWRVAEYSTHRAELSPSFDENMIRSQTLVPSFEANAVWLGHVPAHQAVYSARSSKSLVYAAFARIGLGKLGFLGDTNFGEEPERLIVAMAHIDREEEAFQEDMAAV